MGNPLVVIKCLVFNQKKFLKQMLEGIVKQHTDFKYVAIVHDDCSTDGTQEVIAEYAAKYPEIIIPMYEEENLWSKPGGVLAKKVNKEVIATGAKYLCLCEGDDYWESHEKLQKQVDFLESHPDYSMVFSKVRRFDDSKATFRDIWGGPYNGVPALLAENVVPTPSVMMRMSIWQDFLKDVAPDLKPWLMGDYPMWLYMAIKGKIYCFDEPLAVYRIQGESACRSRSLRKTFNFRKNFFDISDFIREKFQVAVSPGELEKILKEKYNQLLVPAFLLKEYATVDEAADFYNRHPKGVKERLVLDFPFIARPLLKWKYRRDGMIID